jgi:hypothetical protein
MRAARCSATGSANVGVDFGGGGRDAIGKQYGVHSDVTLYVNDQFVGAHVSAWVARVVADNVKEGVLTPDIYDPTLHPLYRDVLAQCGVVALPCRVRDRDRKAKVEAAVGHAQNTPGATQQVELWTLKNGVRN